jgi:hypothetical protein
VGGASVPTMKYHYFRSFFTYSVIRRARRVHAARLGILELQVGRRLRGRRRGDPL